MHDQARLAYLEQEREHRPLTEAEEGFVEANLIWREYEPNRQYAFFAESGDKLYCHNLIVNRYEVVDRLTKAPIYEPSSFDTFNELLEQVLRHMLDRYGVEQAEDETP